MILLDITGGVLIVLAWAGGGILFLTLLPLIFIIRGLINRKSNPDLAKKAFIKAGIFFLIGAGICGGPSLVISLFN